MAVLIYDFVSVVRKCNLAMEWECVNTNRVSEFWISWNSTTIHRMWCKCLNNFSWQGSRLWSEYLWAWNLERSCVCVLLSDVLNYVWNLDGTRCVLRTSYEYKCTRRHDNRESARRRKIGWDFYLFFFSTPLQILTQNRWPNPLPY